MTAPVPLAIWVAGGGPMMALGLGLPTAGAAACLWLGTEVASPAELLVLTTGLAPTDVGLDGASGVEVPCRGTAAG